MESSPKIVWFNLNHSTRQFNETRSAFVARF